MQGVLFLVLELLIVFISVLLGAEMAASFRIIPAWLIRIPTVHFTREDLQTIAVVFVGSCAAAFIIVRLFAGWGVFGDSRRAAKEIYALIAGIVTASLLLFFLTPINFSPELLLDSALVSLALIFLSYVVAGSLRRGTRGSVLSRIGGFLGGLFGLLRSPWSWLVVAYALSPILVARQFVADRDFANWVTRIRVAANVTGDYGFELVNALGDVTFLQPIMAQFADGDPGTLYVLERAGRLYRVDYPSGADKTLLLDIRDRVGYVEVENGALGFDLHPEFGQPNSPNAGFVYIYYTEYRQDSQTNRLTRYDLSQPTPEARAASRLPLIEQVRTNSGFHNAGSVEFGPDGFLYVAVGEMEMRDCRQRVDCALVGGVLRIDVDQKGGDVSRPIGRQPKDGRTANYFIPLDNPYADRDDVLGEYFAHGLRNPFRISFDSKTGALWAGDVGSLVWEEVNVIKKGGNYQFPYIEGRTPERHPKPEVIVGVEFGPVLTYQHTAFRRAVIGGGVYRGDQFPELEGMYIFGDNYSGEIMAIPARDEVNDAYQVIGRARDVAQRGLTSLVASSSDLLVTVMGGGDDPTGVVAKLVRAGSGGKVATMESSGDAVSPGQVQAIFSANCARCHGASGRGDGPDARDLGTHVPDFSDPNYHRWRSDEAILAALKGGGEAVGQSPAMPPWEGILTEAEMVGLKDYVRALAPKK